MIIFRQLFDQASSTYTYLLADSKSRQSVVIDPVFEQVRRDRALVEELDLSLVYVLDTHCHADHITGAWLLHELCDASIAVSVDSGVEGADRYLSHGERVEFGGRYLEARATPGHTNGCMSYVLDDESMVFTGDALLIRGCGRTDFQQGSAERLFRSVREQVLSLPEACRVYPAHDYRGITVSTVGEERRFNPRLGGDIGLRDFCGYMENLGLPHPRQIDIAVPANLRCGRPEGGALLGLTDDWAPLTYTFAGVSEIAPQWLEEHGSEVQLIDVREPNEFFGPLGHIPGAKLIPLGSLLDELDQLDARKPVVTVCRSGARSAQATVLLANAGVDRVANLSGGMLRWRAEGRGVVGGEV